MNQTAYSPLFFFFLSRRRHTRCYRDWSSDVCSSDLFGGWEMPVQYVQEEEGGIRVNPEELHYTQSHEWVRIDGEIGTIGITDHAQKELGEIVYLELPEVGHVYNAEDEFGTVESVKAVSELFTPVSGEVVEVNKAAVAEPGIVND